MKKVFVLLIFFVVFSCKDVYPESGIGKIIYAKGEVKIDKLAGGIFEDARVDDTIYMRTIIKTGNEGKAVVVIIEKKIVLYSGSQISGEELYRETRLSGFEELMNIFYSACINFLTILFPGEEIRPSGFRDVNAAETIDKGITWQGRELVEQEIPSTYAHAIAEKDYLTALSLLDEHRELSVSATDIRLLRGFCHFQLRHYKEAYTVFHNTGFALLSDSSLGKEKSGFYTIVLFQKCLAAYLIHKEGEARKQLTDLMEASKDEALADGMRELAAVLQKE
ncbi:MAG: hypothetical protein JXB88_09505 [Spirochaetales bacterium]|nr:hypothetical protein [Spirochaetales bacterium]